jgi:DNA polymerase I-like protein with 3'-5' exonuclease and polymerase domains
MTHSNPNVAQTPSVKAPFGKECRSLWTVPAGKKLVGVDVSGLELRMLAHFMNDPEYAREVIEGDVHTANQEAAGLSNRDQAKTFISMG